MKFLSSMIWPIWAFTALFNSLSAEVVKDPAPVVKIKTSSPGEWDVAYKGISPEQMGGRDALINPERGWRYEMIFYANNLENPFWPGPPVPVKQQVEDNERLYGETCRIAQVYFYLTAYVGKDIEPIAFTNMQSVFDELRKLGYKVVLRFSYDIDFDKEYYYTLDDVTRHIDQLKPFLNQNADLLLVWQAGFLGPWGEWGPNLTNIQQDANQTNKLLTHLVNALPSGMLLQVRYPWHRDMATDPAIKARIGYHDDCFQPGVDEYGPNQKYYWNGKEYEGTFWPEVLADSPTLINDGEMCYDGEGGPWNENIVVEGLKAARRLQSMHYTTFSDSHNTRCTIPWWKGETPASFCIYQGSPPKLTKEQVRQANLPVSKDYFQTEDGGRWPFEYIRDHLGYRLELQSAELKKNSDSELKVNVDICNVGFSAIHKTRPVYLVLLDEQGNILQSQLTSADPTSWQVLPACEESDLAIDPPVYTISAKFDLRNLNENTYQIGLWLPDNSSTLKSNHQYAIQLANGNTPWAVTDSYGMNIITTLVLEP